jgi:hypothetical protein
MRLVAYQESFWDAVKEVCTINEPLVKVLRLVNRDKPAMGYLYEAMDRAKESIHAYCYPHFLGITRRSCLEAHRS